MFEPAFPAFFMGLMGAGHCLGMCGGIVTALGFTATTQSAFQSAAILAGYNIGRLGSYSLMGLIAAYVGSRVSFGLGLPVLQLLSSLLLIATGLYLSRWWGGLAYLEKLGTLLWRYLRPFSAKLFPVTRWYNAILLGAIWGWLPCGLVYSALAYSATQSSALGGAVIMFSFALGTLPAILVGGLAAERLAKVLTNRLFRRAAGLAFMAYGLWSLASLLLVFGDQHPHPHHH